MALYDFKTQNNNSILPIDSGSNSNGNWIKFEDGTLIQYGNVTLTSGTTASTSGLYTKSHYVGENTKNFPIPFVSLVPTTSIVANINYEYHTVGIKNTTLTKMDFQIITTTSGFSTPTRWLAIGRWK